MKTTTFRKHIDAVILSRGEDYYTNNSVTKIEQSKDGRWISTVEGSDSYLVEISLNNQNIESWYCDCSYDHGPICKHVAATLFAIEQVMENPNNSEAKKLDKKPTALDEIFANVSKQDLQDFITNSLMGHGNGVENSLMVHFGHHISGNLSKKYKEIIKNIFDDANEYYDSYNRYSQSSFSLSDSVYALLDTVQSLQEKNKVKEAIVICQCLIEEFAENIQYMGNDNDSYLLEEVFNVFHELFAEVDATTKNQLFYYCLQEYPKDKYHDFGYDDNFLFFLMDLISNKKHQTIFLEMLDAQIKQTEDDGSNYKHVNYLKTKYDFLKDNNHPEKAHLLLLDNLQYSEFRKIAINQALEAKNFKQAKNLCLDGVNIAITENTRGTKRDFYDLLLRIAEQTKDKEDICKWAEILYQQSYRDMDYYKKLKAAYPKKQWQKKCESIIKQIQGQGQDLYGGYRAAEDIANIFVYEKHFERLLKLLQINSTRIQLIDKYAQHLINLYPNQTIDLYAIGIKRYAEKTGRPIYHQTVAYMKTLSKIPNSKFMINELLIYFKSNYKNRPAMMEILKNFFHQ